MDKKFNPSITVTAFRMTADTWVGQCDESVFYREIPAEGVRYSYVLAIPIRHVPPTEKSMS